MNSDEKIERYKELFKDDPLYQEIRVSGWLDELFAPCYLYERVFFDMTYSTKQAAELLEIPPGKEQTLLNYLNRNDFISYIEIHRRGSRGFYRYDYKTLFQFKMILLLSDHQMAPFDIAAIIGTRPEYTYKETLPNRGMNTSLPAIPNVEELIEERTKQITTKMIQYVQHLEKSVLKNQKHLMQKDLDQWESEMRGLVGRIEDIELNMTIYENILKRLPSSSSARETKSFWGRLFGSSSSPTNEEENFEYKEKLEELKERHQKLLELKQKMDAKKESILSSIKEASTKYEGFNSDQNAIDENSNAQNKVRGE